LIERERNGVIERKVLLLESMSLEKKNKVRRRKNKYQRRGYNKTHHQSHLKHPLVQIHHHGVVKSQNLLLINREREKEEEELVFKSSNSRG